MPLTRDAFPALVALLLAIPSIASVGVREIEFNKVDEYSSEGEWLECAIEVDVRRDASDRLRKRPEYIDDLVVNLTLGIEVESYRQRQRGFEFYTSEASLVSLKEGRHFVRFYLPPEVVERDRIGSGIRYFLVRLARTGETLHEYASDDLRRPDIRESFLGRVEGESSKNDGLLLPQWKTPFVTAYSDDTPSFKGSEIPTPDPQ